MASRDGEGKAPRTKAGRNDPERGAKKPSTKSAPAKSAPSSAESARSGPASVAPSLGIAGAPRRPVQVVRDKPTSRSFWVFCDDGSVWVTRYKKGSLRWVEAGPPLPGSPEERRGNLAGRLEGAKES